MMLQKTIKLRDLKFANVRLKVTTPLLKIKKKMKAFATIWMSTFKIIIRWWSTINKCHVDKDDNLLRKTGIDFKTILVR